jgi:hypothetical protein
MPYCLWVSGYSGLAFLFSHSPCSVKSQVVRLFLRVWAQYEDTWVLNFKLKGEKNTECVGIVLMRSTHVWEVVSSDLSQDTGLPN